MKMLLKIVVVLVLLVVIAVAAGFYFIDSIAKSAVESGGTYALGVPTTLDSADVGVLSGEFGMKGLKVANPSGFKTDHFLKMDQGDVAVSFATLQEQMIVLPNLHLKTIDVNIEQSVGSANYRPILESLRKLESGTPPTGNEKKFVVREVLIEGLVVHAKVTAIAGIGTDLNFPLEEIRLKDVGSESDGGMVMGELAGVIVKAVLTAVAEKGGPILPADLLNDLRGQLDSLESLSELGVNMTSVGGKALDDLMKGDVAGSAKGLIEGATKGAEDAAKTLEDAAKGIGDLIPGKKK